MGNRLSVPPRGLSNRSNPRRSRQSSGQHWVRRQRMGIGFVLCGALLLLMLIRPLVAIGWTHPKDIIGTITHFSKPSPLAFMGKPSSIQRFQPINIPPDIHAIPQTLATTYIAQAAARQFGHIAYSELDANQLMVVGSYAAEPTRQRFESLHPDAGLALMKMIDRARLESVWIIPTSGFRDQARQGALFEQEVQLQGLTLEAAKAVAPPGYSEHHTGYAIDLADGRDFYLDFGQTPAFQWLTQHASEFGFELSFPPNNDQGVMYEPWHWRYVGSAQAKAVFAEARSEGMSSAASQ